LIRFGPRDRGDERCLSTNCLARAGWVELAHLAPIRHHPPPATKHSFPGEQE
jgi:hypothetical protein